MTGFAGFAVCVDVVFNVHNPVKLKILTVNTYMNTFGERGVL